MGHSWGWLGRDKLDVATDGHQDPWAPCEAAETREEERWDGEHGARDIPGGEAPAAFDHWSELQSEL